MNEFKIKIYDKFNKTICDVSEIDFVTKKVTALYKGFLPNIFDFDDVEIIRSSGLKDKNNREIFERDILFNGTDFSEVEYNRLQACFIGTSGSKVERLVDLVKFDHYVVDEK
jgi:uncharacterized phage protein (TIGR01671 family)